MFDFILHNGATIVVAGLVAAVLVAIVVKMIRDKKKGKHSCGGNCENCPGAGSCHTK